MLLGVNLSARRFQHGGKAEMRDRRIRCAFQQQFELRYRLIEAAKRPQPAPEIIAGLAISRIKRHCSLEAGTRV